MAETFSKSQTVYLNEEGLSRTSIRCLGPGPFDVRTYMSVSPGEQKLACHHQRLRVGVPGETWTTDWISGAYFTSTPPAPTG
jgi:hypothetical protein